MYTLNGDNMNKHFSNIIVLNNKMSIEELILKIEKNLKDLGYNITDNNTDRQIDFIYSNINDFVVICSDYYKFENLSTNKSNIRKISKNTAQDVFMISSLENNMAILEKYSFNKRVYDFIALGEEDELETLEYDIVGKYSNRGIWKNFFVGRNTIKNLEEILNKKNTYFRNDQLLLDILKLYGISEEAATYNLNDNIIDNEISKITIFFNE